MTTFVISVSFHPLFQVVVPDLDSLVAWRRWSLQCGKIVALHNKPAFTGTAAFAALQLSQRNKKVAQISS
ncbi:MAG: hypothetical protein AAGJ28_10925 [Pseudomonadota bacterium]